MNILYFCNVNSSLPLELGVFKKVCAQCLVLKNVGHNVFLACLDGCDKFTLYDSQMNKIDYISLNNKRAFYKDSIIYSFIKQIVDKHNIGCIYSRWSTFSFSSYLLYRELRKKNVRILLEIPTYPISQRWTSIRQSVRNLEFNLALRQLYNATIGSIGILFYKKSIDCIVNNNGFEKIWGINVIPITNGIDVKTIPCREHIYNIDKTINVISVANVAHWHGYDRFIKGLGIYYKNNPKINVSFTLIGPGLEVDILKKMAHDLNISEYIKFPGAISGEKLNEYFNNADLGISVLGVHRNKMTTYDSLKAREFCARTLPFITEEAESHYLNKRFVLYVPSDDTPIDINKVVEFAQNISKNYSSIAEEMLCFSNQFCDWNFAFNNVVKYIESISEYKRM